MMVMFVGMVMVVVVPMMVVLFVMVVPVVVSLMIIMLVVIMVMGSFFSVGLGDCLIQTAIAHLYINNQRQGHLAMLSMEDFGILPEVINVRFHCFQAF